MTVPFFAIGNEELAEVEDQRLCNPKILRCRECGKLLQLEASVPRSLIIGKCVDCDKQYLVALGDKENTTEEPKNV